MEFDVFDKLSELETRIHFLKKEIEEKNLIIASLTSKNAELEQRLAGAGVTHQSNSEVTQPDIPVPTPKPSEKIAVVDSDLTKIGDKSIAEALKEASDSAVRSTGYTFDERTGLYYDHNSGYYYDPENQLFYEPRRGIYYSYNSETGEYTYQSSASRTQLKAQYEKLISDPAYQHEIKKSQRDVSKANFNFDRDSPRSLSGDSTHNRHRSVRRRRRRSSSSSARRRRRLRHRSRSTSATSDRSRSRLHRRRLIKYSSDSDASLPRSSSHSGRSRRHHKRHRSTSSHSERVHKDKHRSRSRDSGKSASDKKTCLAAEPVRYPPVVRLMVLASDHVPLGQVFIITSTESSKGWGCIGRSSHLCPSVNFPEDPAVSAIHCEIVFKSKDDRYILIDRDSQSGTYVNGQQISKKTDVPLCHGDVLRVGSSRLLVHIHDGQESCGQCDPEIVKAAFEASADSNENKTDTNEKILDEELSGLSGTALREAKRRATLDELKGKYGLKRPVPAPKSQDPPTYNDRAAQRRAIEHNLKSAGYELPQPPGVTYRRNPNLTPLITASTSVPISGENRGAKMLSKMGWNPGQGLGKTSSGIAEPIPVAMRPNPTAGLGSGSKSLPRELGLPLDATPKEIMNAKRLAITRERYDKLD